MDALVKLVTNYFPTAGLFIAVVVAVSFFMDRAIKPSLKSKLLQRLYHTKGTKPADGILGQVPTYYEIIHDLFGLKAFGKFITRSFVITLLLLIILFVTQALFNSRYFWEDTFPFLKQLAIPDGRFVLIALSVFIIDLISIYQTITFLRISRGCNNFFEVTFVAIADLLLSVTLFILLFPLFVTFAFFQDRPSASIYAVLSSAPTAQGTQTISDMVGILVFPPPQKPDMTNREIQNQRDRNWAVRVYAVSLYNGSDGTPNLREATLDSTKVGDIPVQTRGNLSDVEVLEILAKFLKELPAIETARLIEGTQGFFNASALFQISANPAIEYKYFWRTYSGVLKQINFLDDEFFRVVTLRSPGISQNNVMFQYNVAEGLPRYADYSRNQHIYCDGRFTALEKIQALKIEDEFDSCEKAVALDSAGANNVASVTRYQQKGDISVPIAPFALSSLTATFVIYYMLLTRLVFVYVGSGVVKFFSNGDQLLKQHLFLTTSTLLIAFLLPVLFMVKILE